MKGISVKTRGLVRKPLSILGGEVRTAYTRVVVVEMEKTDTQYSQKQNTRTL